MKRSNKLDTPDSLENLECEYYAEEYDTEDISQYRMMAKLMLETFENDDDYAPEIDTRVLN